MDSRFQRRGAPPEVTFFVFQDILTSMIGVLIIVTLTLALQPGDASSSAADGQRVEAGLARKLDAALADVAALRIKFDSPGKTKGYTPSEASIQAEAASLRRQIAVFGQANLQRERKAGKLASSESDAILAEEARGMQLLEDKTRQQRDHLAAEVTERKKKLGDAEEAFHVADAALSSEKHLQKVLRLIPETSGTNKQPVLVVAGRGGFQMTLFDAERTTNTGSVLDFAGRIRQLKKSDQFIVFFIKPSAAHEFKEYVDVAKSAGFEVGYDLVGEEVTFEVPKP